jgi:hypothetical protein
MHLDPQKAVVRQLAIDITKLAVTADAETIQVHGRHRPDDPWLRKETDRTGATAGHWHRVRENISYTNGLSSDRFGVFPGGSRAHGGNVVGEEVPGVAASCHDAPQVSNTQMARRLARRQARTFPTGLISGARRAEAVSGGWCRAPSQGLGTMTYGTVGHGNGLHRLGQRPSGSNPTIGTPDFWRR